jgi:regulator of sirC expression with transglutaminase-like and TPR domain
LSQGRVLTHPAVARQRFRELSQLDDSRLDLTEASLVIALEEYPAMRIESYLERLDQWSDAIRERIEGSSAIERVVEEINRLLFEEEGFRGDSNPLDPRYAFLNEVLDLHAGVPIALSILYIDLSRRLGLPASGVPLPGHFLVKVSGPWGQILIDPSEEGRVLSTVECQKLMDQVYGGGVRLREHHLRSTTNREILERLLSHLKNIYLAQHDLAGAVSAIDRILLLDDRDPYEIRDRGVLAMQLHNYREAITFLERYLDLAPHADDRRTIKEQIDYLRAWLDRN